MAIPAWKAAADIAEGYLTFNSVSLKRYEMHELVAVTAEIEKLSRETRALAVPQDDADASQKKNRRLLRLSQALSVLTAHKSKLSR